LAYLEFAPQGAGLLDNPIRNDPSILYYTLQNGLPDPWFPALFWRV